VDEAAWLDCTDVNAMLAFLLAGAGTAGSAGPAC
jgi:hypothetical protein